MKNIGFDKIYMGNELYKRALLNYDRLEQKDFQPENIFKDGYEWPGDIEGRTILALVLLSRATHRNPIYLDEIMNNLQFHLNENGYFGRVLSENCFDEQQISGNSWALRGLIEYYTWKKDENSFKIIQNIVNNLLLPAKGYYAKYPIDPQDRIFEGKAIGNLVENAVGNWYSSTDIGCAFIMLDGATHAYELLGMNELKELIDEMIEKYLSIDLVSLSFQTHATLSALRGILRYYGLTGDFNLNFNYLGDGKYTISNTEIVLSPINNLISYSMDEAIKSSQQILFKQE